MKLLTTMAVVAILLASAGCGNGTASTPGQGAKETPALAAATAAPSSEASLPTAGPSGAPDDASPAATGAAPSPEASVSAAPDKSASGGASGSAAHEDKEVWAAVDKALESENYSSVVEIFEKVPDPSEDLKAMYNLALYNIYGQDGDDEKSLEYLYKIPAGYKGRHADLVSYWKFIYESFAQGRTDNITFDEYKQKYYQSGKSTH
ncbi:hypothetical protein [Paenibacillus rhizophilus]|uniref:Lipoprotein n=1 Tax=Paenibacillus rhizophilus TaxID=1850366 RepID=A0A3N9P3A5_9BACL|nr:hypothetical protein [Paenibacillus rhizophilus]RQW09564.1 hypothetical protein EH198_19005 [Paenibacillus rhizophilus]